MRLFPLLLVTSILCGCSAQISNTGASIVLSDGITSCPKFSSNKTIHLAERKGSDFLLCEFTSSANNEPLFSMYVGNASYDDPKELIFYGASTSKDGNLVWFKDSQGSTLRTFMPTKDRAQPYAVVWFSPKDLGDFKQKADLVAELRTDNANVF